MANVFFMRTAEKSVKDNDKWSLGITFDEIIPFIPFKVVSTWRQFSVPWRWYGRWRNDKVDGELPWIEFVVGLPVFSFVVNMAILTRPSHSDRDSLTMAIK